MRRFILFLVGLVLVLQVLASLVETAVYAGEKIFLDKYDLAYTKGWQYYFKWVIKPLSAAIAFSLLLPTLCSCCRGPDRSKGRGHVYPSILGFLSLVMTALWAVIVGYQVRNTDNTTANSIIHNTLANNMFVYPLGEGFSLKNNCNASPFTMIDNGSTACKLLKAESGLSIGCLGLWGLTFIFSTLLCCIVRRAHQKHVSDEVYALSPQSAHHQK
ncbi:hypothetical protein LPJ64_005935 [Coemansia asiatica]|uniref:Uncharacterized protein n=1 Tax=Coemansia asiatica TaxID=1052880 RepID=A0A9W8CH67_9FUNG|nr:hypothetical protein LPJ64_005935 [Coemansia asiatica]